MPPYCKIPKISPGGYIFQRSLFLEGLIFGGAYLQWEICVSKSWASLIVGRKFTVLALRAISKYKPYIWRGDLTEGFLRYEVGGGGGGRFYIWRVLYMEGLIFGILRYVPQYDAPKPGPGNHKLFFMRETCFA